MASRQWRCLRRAFRAAVFLSVVAVLALGTASAAVRTATNVKLTVVRKGPGMVKNASGAITCGARCAAKFNKGTLVRLTASGVDGSTFVGWSGACGGEVARCVLFLDAGASTTAQFEPANVDLDVIVGGAGRVTSEPPGVTCGIGGDDCGHTFRETDGRTASRRGPADERLRRVVRRVFRHGRLSAVTDHRPIGSCRLPPRLCRLRDWIGFGNHRKQSLARLRAALLSRLAEQRHRAAGRGSRFRPAVRPLDWLVRRVRRLLRSRDGRRVDRHRVVRPCEADPPGHWRHARGDRRRSWKGRRWRNRLRPHLRRATRRAGGSADRLAAARRSLLRVGRRLCRHRTDVRGRARRGEIGDGDFPARLRAYAQPAAGQAHRHDHASGHLVQWSLQRLGAERHARHALGCGASGFSRLGARLHRNRHRVHARGRCPDDDPALCARVTACPRDPIRSRRHPYSEGHRHRDRQGSAAFGRRVQRRARRTSRTARRSSFTGDAEVPVLALGGHLHRDEHDLFVLDERNQDGHRLSPHAVSPPRLWSRMWTTTRRLLGSVKAWIIGLGALAGAVGAVLALVFIFFPGLRPCFGDATAEFQDVDVTKVASLEADLSYTVETRLRGEGTPSCLVAAQGRSRRRPHTGPGVRPAAGRDAEADLMLLGSGRRGHSSCRRGERQLQDRPRAAPPRECRTHHADDRGHQAVVGGQVSVTPGPGPSLRSSVAGAGSAPATQAQDGLTTDRPRTPPPAEVQRSTTRGP